tara:strand:+ start:16245 stop:16832 length:588 start_codon:yes stop_codon:yes gene_type:complete
MASQPIETWTDVVALANELIRTHNLQSKQVQFINIARTAWDAIRHQPIRGEFNIKEELEKQAIAMNNQIRNAQAFEDATEFLGGHNEVLQVLQARATGNWEGIAAASNHRVRTKMLEILDSMKNKIVKECQLDSKALHGMYMPTGRPTDKELERRMHAVLHALKERLCDNFTKDDVKKALNIIVTADVESHKIRF